MTWQLVEAPIRELAAYIDGAQAAKLANVAARSEYATTYYELAEFVAIRHHEPPDNPEAAYPVLYLRPVRATIRPGVGGLSRGFIGGYQYMFAVLCSSVGQGGPDAALAMAERYMLAVLEMTADYFSRADARTIEWGMVSDPEISYEPLYTTSAGEFVADVRMLITAQIREGEL